MPKFFEEFVKHDPAKISSCSFPFSSEEKGRRTGAWARSVALSAPAAAVVIVFFVKIVHIGDKTAP